MESRMIGLRPSRVDFSLISLSIVSGKKSSMAEMTELARVKMRLCDRKFTVSWRTLGAEKSVILSICLRSQNLKPTPLAMVYAVSPAK